MSSYLLLGPEAGAKADEVKRIRSELAAKYGDGGVQLLSVRRGTGELFTSPQRLALQRPSPDSHQPTGNAGAAFLNELAGYLPNQARAQVVLASASITKKIMDAIPKERTGLISPGR